MFHSADLRSVILTGGEFLRRRELVRGYLASFDTDRLLHTFRLNAGLPSSAEPLGGWESEDCGLRGHFTGHFLSACARFAYAEGGGPLEAQARAVVAGLAMCAKPNGYLAAFPEETLDILEREEDRGVWAPYYTLHKLLQGLIDCASLLGDRQALSLARGLADYVGGRFEKLSCWKIDGILRCAKLNPVNEFGGMGDALYQLYELTGERRYLETAKLFDRPYFLSPLSEGQDVLTDLHANTHLPMILAAMRRYELTREDKYRYAVLSFAHFLEGRSFANGNSSAKAAHPAPGQVSEKSEHWGACGDLSDALTGGESESCCAHNAERILSRLFSWTGEVSLLDRLAVLKYNAVLNCASPETGLSQYHQPLGEGVHKIFSGAYDTFWCCTASGVEAMSELQKNIWFEEDESGLLLNVFVPSRYTDGSRGFSLTLETDYPRSLSARITVRAEQPVPLRLFFRASRVSSAAVNGEEAALSSDGGLAVLSRTFRDGDAVSLTLSSPLTLSPLPGDGSRAAVLYGDVLLAQQGTLPLSGVCGGEPEAQFRRLPDGASFAFRNREGQEAVFVPLYAMNGETYTVYCRLHASDTASAPFTAAQDGSAAY